MKPPIAAMSIELPESFAESSYKIFNVNQVVTKFKLTAARNTVGLDVIVVRLWHMVYFHVIYSILLY